MLLAFLLLHFAAIRVAMGATSLVPSRASSLFYEISVSSVSSYCKTCRHCHQHNYLDADDRNEDGAENDGGEADGDGVVMCCRVFRAFLGRVTPEKNCEPAAADLKGASSRNPIPYRGPLGP